MDFTEEVMQKVAKNWSHKRLVFSLVRNLPIKDQEELLRKLRKKLT